MMSRALFDAQPGRDISSNLLTRAADVVDHTVGRVLDLFDIDTGKVKRWS